MLTTWTELNIDHKETQEQQLLSFGGLFRFEEMRRNQFCNFQHPNLVSIFKKSLQLLITANLLFICWVLHKEK